MYTSPDGAMGNRLNILVVEDNFDHLKLTEHILKRNKVPGELFIVRDGEEAVDFLYNRNRFAGQAAGPRPDLVLLDLNIPRVDGKEVLKIIKTDDLLKDIPVVVVSSSDRPEDVSFARDCGASGYISKSGGFEKLNDELSKVHLLANALVKPR
jgi:two-component system response regulator